MTSARHGLRILTTLLLLAATCRAADFTPEVSSAMDRLYIRAAMTYAGFSKVEFHFTVHADGTTSDVTGSNESQGDRVVLTAGDMAIFHTHPAGCDPRPSPDDVKVAQHAGIPNYVLSRDALWVATPDGKIVKVGNVTSKHGHIMVQ